jgi:hypothetical protein
MKTRRIALRALANGRLVCADLNLGGEFPLAANRDAIGPWETFEVIELDEGNGSVVVEPPRPIPEPIPPTPPPISPSPGGPILDRVVRITDEQDGELLPRMYSYWSNAVILGDGIYVFAGSASGLPRFFRVSRSGEVTRLGPLLLYPGTAEGWYWDAHGWIYLLHGSELRRVHPFTGNDRVVFSIRETHPGCRLWQAHSSEDGQTHSATVEQIVEEGPYPRLGTVVSRYGEQRYFAARGALDESQITPDGAFLIIKEDDDNRIITLETGEQRIIREADGAVGHSDCGPGIVVGEFSHGDYGECVLWDLRGPLTLLDHRRVLFKTWNMGHLSIRGGICLLSNAEGLHVVDLDRGGVRFIGNHGMRSDGTYDTQCRANLDPTGRIACYMSNREGRMDVYLAPVPR